MNASTIYLIMLLVGLFFAIGSLLLSGLFGSDVGAGDVDADTGDASAIGIFSPPVIAIFLVGFGGGGYYADSSLGYGLELSLPIALASGFVVGGMGAWVLYKFISMSEGHSNVKTSTLIGGIAEVVTTIPEKGMGQVVVVAMGTRLTGPATSSNGQAIPAGSAVRILRIAGGTYHVEPLPKGSHGKANEGETQ